LKKNINHITSYFVEEDPGRDSEDIKKECNVNCFDFFFFFVFFYGGHGWKNHNQLNRTTLKKNMKKQMHTGKELEAH